MDYLLPIFPLPDIVLFPRTHQGFHLFEERNRRLIKFVMKNDQRIAVGSLRPGWEENCKDSPPVHRVLTATRLLFQRRNADGTWDILVEGIERVELLEEVQKRPFRIGRVRPLVEEVKADQSEETRALMEEVAQQGEAIARSLPVDSGKTLSNLVNKHQHPAIVADIVAGALVRDPYARQSILSEQDLFRRLCLVRIQLQGLANEMRARGVELE